jgi:hypothetical protein
VKFFSLSLPLYSWPVPALATVNLRRLALAFSSKVLRMMAASAWSISAYSIADKVMLMASLPRAREAEQWTTVRPGPLLIS